MADDRTILLSVELDTSKLEKAAKDAADNITRLKEQQAQLREEGKKDTVEYKKIAVEIQRYNKELTQTAKALNTAERVNEKQTGSLEEMRAQVQAATLAYSKLTAEQRDTSAGEAQLDTLNELREAVNNIQKSYGNAVGDVGKYEESINSALEAQNQLNDSLGITEEEVLDVSGTISKAEDRLYEMAIAGDTTSDEFIRLQEQTAKYKKVVIEVDASIDQLAESGGALGSALQIGEGVLQSYQAAVGVTALVGVEQEKLLEILTKLEAIQAVLNSVESAKLALQKNSIKFTQLQAGAQKALNTVLGEGTKATKLLRGALLASGVGALVVGIGALIENFDELQGMLPGLSKEQEIFNEHLDDYKQGAVDAITKTNEVETAFRLAEKGVISKDEALQTYNETLGDSFGEMDNLNDAEATFIKKKDAFIQATAQRSLAQALFAKAAEEQADAITAGLEDQISITDKVLESTFVLLRSEEETRKRLQKLQSEGVKEARKSAEERFQLLLNEGMKALELAETIEDANDISSESEKELESDRKRRASEQKKRQEEEIKAAEALAKRIAELSKTERQITLSDERKVLEAHYQFLETIAGDNADELLKIEANKNADLRALELKELAAAEASIQQKYANEIQSAEGNADLITAIEKAKQAELDSIRTDANNTFVQREIEFIEKQKQIDAERVMNQKTINEELKILSLELALEKVKGSEMELDAWKALQDERISQLQRYRDTELSIEGKTASEKEKIETSTALQIEQIRNESFEQAKAQNEQDLQQRQQLAQSILNNANQLAQSLFQITANRIQKELNALTVQYNTDSELLQEQLDANLISQADFIAQKTELDAQFKAEESKIKKEQFEKDRAASLINAGIATALAIAQALPNIPLSITAGVLGGAQIAFIASQPTPEFEKGGLVKEGVFGGNLHSNGGTKGVFEDGTRVEVERDEAFFILNRKATAAISALSAHNVAHGGASFYENGGPLKFEGGGAFAATQTNSTVQRFNNQNAFVEAVKSLPPGVVLVEQAANALDNQKQIEVRSSF